MWSCFGVSALELPAIDCVITPNITIDLSSPVPGVLSEVLVERSDIVRSGQDVACMESSVEQAEVVLARERSRLESDIGLGEVNLTFDQRQQQRLTSLNKKQAIAQNDVDEAERSFAISNWKLQQAKDLRKLRVLELRKAEEQLEQKQIRSPINGVVVQRYKQAGEYVENQSIVRIAQLDTLAVEAIVPMELFDQISKGMQANVFPETSPDEPKRAAVTIVDRMGDASSGTFGVRLTLRNEEMAVPAGVKCSLKFLADLPLKGVDTAPPPTTDAARVSPLTSTMLSQQDAEQTEADGLVLLRKCAVPVAIESPDEPQKVAAQENNQPELPQLEQGLVESKIDPEPVPVERCISVGPFTSQTEAESTMQTLAQEKVETQLRESQVEVGMGFVVMALPYISLTESRKLIKDMAQQGIEDAFLMRQGHISLGIYSKLSGAEQRQQQLANLGFDSELSVQAIRETQWWLDIVDSSSREGMPDLEQRLLDEHPTIEFIPQSCQQSLTTTNI